MGLKCSIWGKGIIKAPIIDICVKEIFDLIYIYIFLLHIFIEEDAATAMLSLRFVPLFHGKTWPRSFIIVT